MASFPQPPTRIKLRRDAIIHAIAFTDDLYAVGDDEALTVFDASIDRAIQRFEEIGTVLSVCFVGDRVAAGTLDGVVVICDYEGANLSLAPASSEREGVRAIAATGSRLAAGDAAGRVCVWFIGEEVSQPLFSLRAARDRQAARELAIAKVAKEKGARARALVLAQRNGGRGGPPAPGSEQWRAQQQALAERCKRDGIEYVPEVRVVPRLEELIAKTDENPGGRQDAKSREIAHHRLRIEELERIRGGEIDYVLSARRLLSRLADRT